MKVYEAVLDQLLGAGVSHFAGMVGSTSALTHQRWPRRIKRDTWAFGTNRLRRPFSMQRRASAVSPAV